MSVSRDTDLPGTSGAAPLEMSLVIPAHNEQDEIGRCLDAIRRHASRYLKEVIVVDNASTDATAKIAADYPGVRVVSEPRKGLSNARQRGLVESTGALIAFVDADCLVSPDWAAKAMSLFAQDETMVALSGPYIYFDAGVMLRGALTAVSHIVWPLGSLLFGHLIAGGNFVVRRHAIEAIGGFDPTRFFLVDPDIGRRLRRVGRVRFRLHFPIRSSARRFVAQGFCMTNLRYLYWYLVAHLRRSRQPYEFDAAREN